MERAFACKANDSSVMNVAATTKTPPRQLLAKLFRMFGAAERGVRATAWCAVERTLKEASLSWSDVGNWIENESLQSLANAIDKAGVSPDDVVRWIKNGGENDLIAVFNTAVEEAVRRLKEEQQSGPPGYGRLLTPVDMAQFCFDGVEGLPREKDREFIRSVFTWVVIRGRAPTPKQEPWLEDLYFKLGGRV
jgi:hypothetical protein